MVGRLSDLGACTLGLAPVRPLLCETPVRRARGMTPTRSSDSRSAEIRRPDHRRPRGRILLGLFGRGAMPPEVLALEIRLLQRSCRIERLGRQQPTRPNPTEAAAAGSLASTYPSTERLVKPQRSRASRAIIESRKAVSW